MLGKGNEHGDVVVEGGQDSSIQLWIEKMHGPKHEDLIREPSPAPSSILSSVPDDVDMLM